MIRDWADLHLPTFLTTGDKPLWQVAALPIVFVIAYMGARVGTTLLNPLITRLTKHTKAGWDDLLVDRLRNPLRLLLTGLIAQALLPWLDLTGKLQEWSVEGIRIILLLSGFWALLRMVDIGQAAIKNSPWLISRPSTLPIISLLSRVVKIMIFALAVVTSLQQLGYPVAGLIAGLGVGGLAVALAAQKTLEHLLGSVMLSIDQPLQVGALVKVGDAVGFVEQIGLRSTRIRSLSRTIITIPNGKLADSQIENLSTKDRIQFQVVLTLAFGADVGKLLGEIKNTINNHKRFMPEETFVHLRDIGTDGLVIEVNAWMQLEGIEDPRDVRQDMLLKLLSLVNAAGARLAYPTKTLHVVNQQN